MADLEAMNACMDEFVERMEALGALALIAGYTADDGDNFTGASSGFGEGPPLMATMQGAMKLVQEFDAVAVCAVAADFVKYPEDFDFGKQVEIAERSIAEYRSGTSTASSEVNDE